MRVAWFSPLPPVRSGIASANAELLAYLDADFLIDRFIEGVGRRSADSRVFDAHDFVWKHQLEPYDLVTYQLGNASCHDYIWAYLPRYPGLVVVHDPRLHHARARRLLSQQRFDDYRHEFWFDHPDAPRDFVEYTVQGLGGSIHYFWSMLRVVMRTARIVAVHNERVAADLRDQFPETPIVSICLGEPPLTTNPAAGARIRAALRLPGTSIVFAVFGTLTAEKRIAAIVRAFSTLASGTADVALMLVGDSTGYPRLSQELAASGVADRVRVTGYVADESIGEYLAAADVCLCLRWPTAQETSASWLQCLAAARPTVISDLAHLVDIPAVDPRTWTRTLPAHEPVTVTIDLLDEDRSLLLAMRRLAEDARLRAELARAGHAYWAAEHTLDRSAAIYRRLLTDAAARPSPAARDLPAHLTADHAELARSIAKRFGVEVDVLK